MHHNRSPNPYYQHTVGDNIAYIVAFWLVPLIIWAGVIASIIYIGIRSIDANLNWYTDDGTDTPTQVDTHVSN